MSIRPSHEIGGEQHATEVAIGEIRYAVAPRILVTPALGSCLGVTIYDPFTKRGAMAHIMLPCSPDGVGAASLAKFADHAIPEMVRVLLVQGSNRARLVSKIAGGAAMFSGDKSISGIGARNVVEVKRQLALMSVPLLAEDTGEAHARTVEFALETGELTVRSYRFGVRTL